jgi:hypothetical protein
MSCVVGIAYRDCPSGRVSVFASILLLDNIWNSPSVRVAATCRHLRAVPLRARRVGWCAAALLHRHHSGRPRARPQPACAASHKLAKQSNCVSGGFGCRALLVFPLFGLHTACRPSHKRTNRHACRARATPRDSTALHIV